MLPLYLCSSRPSSRPAFHNCRFVLPPRGALLAAALLGLTPGLPLRAQDKPANNSTTATAPQTPPNAPAGTQTQPPSPVPAAPAINFRERPKYPTDPQRVRRTVQIDGVLSDGEWDPFYTVTDGPIKGTVYCHWDDSYLYLAARTEQPASLLFDVDMGGDGWLRGADNLELVIGSVAENTPLTVTARLLDAANSKDTPTWNDKAVDAKSIQVAGKVTGSTQVIEVAIPKNTASLVLRSGANIGLRAEFLPPGPASAYTPTQPFEPHLLLDATLVDSRIQPAAGINPRLTLSDYKCIPGQKLFATLELLNQRDQAVPLRAVTWSGPGNSVNAVNTLRDVSVPAIPATKAIKLKYNTLLPNNLPTGSYTLLVTAELEDGRQAQSSASFAVVEPLQVQMACAPDPVAIVGTTKLVVNVDVYSAVPDHMRGDIELTNVPAGWTLKGGKKRSVFVDREDAHTVTGFEFKLPSGTAAGEYPVEAQVSWNGRVWKARCLARVTREEK